MILFSLQPEDMALPIVDWPGQNAATSAGENWPYRRLQPVQTSADLAMACALRQPTPHVLALASTTEKSSFSEPASQVAASAASWPSQLPGFRELHEDTDHIKRVS